MTPEEAWQIVSPLVAGPRSADGELENSYADVVQAHSIRRAFFVADAKALNRRANGIHAHIKGLPNNDPALGSGRRPNEKTLPRLASRKPESVGSLARAQTALLAIRDSNDPRVRSLTCLVSDPAAPAEHCYVVRPKTIVPSIYNADRKAITEARERLGMGRLQLTQEVFGQYSSHDIFRLLEDGEGDQTFAVTFAFKRRVEKYFAERGVEKMLFTADPARFGTPLEPARGNLIDP